MDLSYTKEDDAFREEARGWLETELAGEFRALRGRGGPGDEDAAYEPRRIWERRLAAAGWTCLGWPREYGGRALSLLHEMIFFEEYARARAPGRLGHIGETLLGPTLIAFGTEAQKRRFLPPIARAEELWCQGYSEPNAGSDLASVATRAERDATGWTIVGQKTWTSHAHRADWCFALCRTNPRAPKHRGLSYLLVPMRQAGVTLRPIRQMTGTSEFNEVFFDSAHTDLENIVGEIDGGWKIAMATLGFERGASTLGQQLGFASELAAIIAVAKENGAAADPLLRQRLAQAAIGLRVMRAHALRTLTAGSATSPASGELARAAMVSKLYWATWHRELGKLAMDVLGPQAEIASGAPYELTPLQRVFLFSRADTIYAGSNEIQRNILAERALGLPPEPRIQEKTT